ncbi:MAG: twin-arginine translocase TatA/TatE family subunit [Candidatus Wallbacteria bacterium]
MFGINTGEMIVILVIALLVFGPQKLPQIGSAIGKSIREFKKSLNSDEKDINDEKNNKDDNKEK